MRRVLGVFAVVSLLSALTLAQSSQEPPKKQRTLVRAGHVLNVRTGDEVADQTVIIEGDRVVGIAPTGSTPKAAGDQEIDLRSMTVMPGLIDVHTHLTMDTNFDPYHTLTTDPVRQALIGVRNAKATLEAGFTTVGTSPLRAIPTLRFVMRSTLGISKVRTCRSAGPRWESVAAIVTTTYCRSNITPLATASPMELRRSRKRFGRTLSMAPISSRSAPLAECSQKATIRRRVSTHLKN